MRGPMIQTEARAILNEGINRAREETALKMLENARFTIEEIAKYSGLSVEKVKKLAEIEGGVLAAKEEIARRVLKRKKLTMEEIAEDTGLSIEEVEQLSQTLVS